MHISHSSNLFSSLKKILILSCIVASLSACMAYVGPPGPHHWVPGHYNRYGAWIPGHYVGPYYGPYRPGAWVPGHYNRFGAWVPGHWR